MTFIFVVDKIDGCLPFPSHHVFPLFGMPGWRLILCTSLRRHRDIITEETSDPLHDADTSPTFSSLNNCSSLLSSADHSLFIDLSSSGDVHVRAFGLNHPLLSWNLPHRILRAPFRRRSIALSCSSTICNHYNLFRSCTLLAFWSSFASYSYLRPSTPSASHHLSGHIGTSPSFLSRQHLFIFF